MNKYLKGRRLIMILLAPAILYLALSYIEDAIKPSEEWSINKEGLLSYPGNRGPVDYREIVLNDSYESRFSKVIYKSKGEDIYALMRIPKNGDKVPAIIFLPGATVTKEGQDNTARKFAETGYATFTIDERGNGGETKSGIISMEDEFQRFMANEEIIHHKMVFDVLKAYDLLRELDAVDKGRIYVYGESMGGRFAIIAGAIEPGIRSVIGVSTAGYDSLSQNFQNPDVARFFFSIDPDTYIGKIAPRELIMVHSTEDTVIKIDFSRKTFEKANEPKKFVTVTCKTHGFCDDMMAELKDGLDADNSLLR